MWLATASTSVSLSRAGNQVGEGNMWGNENFKGYFFDNHTRGIDVVKVSLTSNHAEYMGIVWSG